MIVTRFALPVRSPMPLIVPCTCVAPDSSAVSEFATAQPESSWQWIPSAAAGQRFAHDRERRADLRRQAAAVRVAQHEPLGARLGGRAQAVERVAGVEREAVEEVLGVEQHALARAARGTPTESAIIARFSSRLTRTTFSTCSTEALPTSVQTGAKDSARTRSPSSSLGRASSRRRVIPKATISALASRSLREQREQLLLLRVRRREAGLDHVHAELVERVDDAQLLLGGERHAAAAHAVAQGGVV